MSVHLPAALARSGACSIQTISSASLPRLTRSAKRTRIIAERYPGHPGQQQVAVIEIKEVTPATADSEELRLRQKHVRPPTRRALRSRLSRRAIDSKL